MVKLFLKKNKHNRFSYSVNHILEGKHKAKELLKSMSVIHTSLLCQPFAKKQNKIDSKSHLIFFSFLELHHLLQIYYLPVFDEFTHILKPPSNHLNGNWTVLVTWKTFLAGEASHLFN